MSQQDALYGLRPELVVRVQNLLDRNQRSVVRKLLLPLHPADVADLLERLDSEKRHQLLDILHGELDPEVLVELNDEVREEVLEGLGSGDLAAAVEELDSDDAVNLVENLGKEEQQEILDALPEEERNALETALSYKEDSAGRLMHREFVSVPPTWTIGQTIDFLREEKELPKEFHQIYVVDSEHQAKGVVELSHLLRSQRPIKMADIMDQNIHPIPVDMDREEVTFIFRQHNSISAAVIDQDKLVGVITIDDVVDVIDEEAEEDLMRLGGVSSDDLYRAVADTTKSRFSWLFVNLLTAILASIVISFFETTIQEIVALAVLMPIVASMGGNAGTQTLTVAVRAIAMKELTVTNALRIIWKEVLVGGCNGFLFAIIMGIIVFFWFKSPAIGLIIASAMLINLIMAGFAGITIPLLFDRLKIDPAISSVVFLTTVTDVIGFLSFLGLATLFLL